jgi:hypothetical protein
MPIAIGRRPYMLVPPDVLVTYSKLVRAKTGLPVTPRMVLAVVVEPGMRAMPSGESEKIWRPATPVCGFT